MKKVGVIYLFWSDEPQRYLEAALEGMSAQTYNRADINLYIVYNSHRPTEESALSYIKTIVNDRRDKLPNTTILDSDKNLGFSGGNNWGVKRALADECDYVLLGNADLVFAPGAVSALVQAMEEDKTIGQAQAFVRLDPERDLINTSGNVWHYSGLGYCGNYRQPVQGFQKSGIYDVGYVSGAATLLRADLLRQYGLWNEAFFMYHEDTEYSLRLKLRGFRVVAVREAECYHRYQLSKNLQKYYWLVRNREIIKYLVYKWPTLLLLFPLDVVYHLGLIPVSIYGGWFKELLKAYRYLLTPSNWSGWRAERKKNLVERVVTDRHILAGSGRTVAMASSFVGNTAAAVANLIFAVYYFCLRLVVWW